MKSEELLKHRFSIMGISSLWIMLFHSGIIMPQGFNIIREIGYGGVDMFFFFQELDAIIPCARTLIL